MRTTRTTLILAVAMIAAACQTVVVDETPVTAAGSEPLVTAPTFAESTTPNTTATTAAHEPIWVTVRYRSDPVDVAYPGRFDVMVPDSTLVDAAAFDTATQYLLVALNGVWYHYCGVPDSEWASFGAASSKGRFYNSELRGSYDCRGGGVPDY